LYDEIFESNPVNPQVTQSNHFVVVSNWLDSLIGSSGLLLLVVSHLFAVPNFSSVLWVGLDFILFFKKNYLVTKKAWM
jgi:hypothetical protein